MSGIPNDYGAGMNAFERQPEVVREEPTTSLLPSADKFAAVDAALTHLGLDIGQAITDPDVARLTEALFAITINQADFKEWNDKPKPKWTE